MTAKILAIVVLAGILSIIYKIVFHNEVENNFYRKGSTKTPYSYIANENTTANIEIGENCYVVQLWLLIRHGTRYPSKKQIKTLHLKIPLLLNQLEKNKLKADPKIVNLIDELVAWNSNFISNVTESHSMNLHVEGEKEMIFLGERYKKRFPKLFENKLLGNVMLYSTNEKRTMHSRKYFAIGLVGRNDLVISSQTITNISDITFSPIVTPHDPLLRMYKLCKKWHNEVKTNNLSLQEKVQFEQSKLFHDSVLVKLSERLGFIPGYLSLEDVDLIDVACSFTQAWNPNQRSPWCALFTDEMSSMLEYRKDLRYYWQDGHGYHINSAQACILVKDAVTGFENAMQDETSVKGRFHFAHSGTVLKLLAYLGLYQVYEHDTKTHLKSENYHSMKIKRNWRTSEIDPFATNVGFVLKKCNKRDYKVGLLHNENMIEIPECKSVNKWCDYDVFLSLFNPKVLNCNFTAICNTK